MRAQTNHERAYYVLSRVPIRIPACPARGLRAREACIREHNKPLEFSKWRLIYTAFVVNLTMKCTL